MQNHGPSATILVVDDEAALRIVVKQVLLRAGYSVLLASSGRAAVETFRQDIAIAVVLLDIGLVDLSAQEVLQQIRAFPSDVPVILASGSLEQDVPEALLAQPRTFFLHKPFSPAALLKKIQTARPTC